MDLASFVRRLLGNSPQRPWILVAVGDPGMQNLERRRALGRQMVVRWGLQFQDAPPAEHLEYGLLYHPYLELWVFLPSVPSTRLGEACLALLGGTLDASRLILAASDGRLKLGEGRLRLSGDMDHPGVQAVGKALRTSRLARLVFGIGPVRPPANAFRNERWSSEEWERVRDLEGPIEQFLEQLRGPDTLSSIAARINTPMFWRSPHT
jgi:peptidyl-tRNA hydrolase